MTNKTAPNFEQLKALYFVRCIQFSLNKRQIIYSGLNINKSKLRADKVTVDK